SRKQTAIPECSVFPLGSLATKSPSGRLPRDPAQARSRARRELWEPYALASRRHRAALPALPRRVSICAMAARPAQQLVAEHPLASERAATQLRVLAQVEALARPRPERAFRVPLRAADGAQCSESPSATRQRTRCPE